LKVVLVIFSSLRADHLGPYGNRWLRTESFDRLAEAGRVFFGTNCGDPDPAGIRMELLTGLDRRRFTEWKPRGEYTLPGRLGRTGYQTALFTDNFPMLELYERSDSFGTICNIPGQGPDRHVPTEFSPFEDAGRAGFNAIISGQAAVPPDDQLDAYARNLSFYGHLGHPSQRLVQAVNDFLAKIRREDRWFILVDAYGLNPPWDPPPEFTRFRNADDAKNLAWPVPGPVNSSDPDISRQINFLRRAYADGCLFLDHLAGKLAAEEEVNLIVMSDHGLLVGDENFLGYRSGPDSPILRRQVLISRGPGVEEKTRHDGPIRPVDLFASILAKLGPEERVVSDGRVVEELFR